MNESKLLRLDEIRRLMRHTNVSAVAREIGVPEWRVRSVLKIRKSIFYETFEKISDYLTGEGGIKE